MRKLSSVHFGVEAVQKLIRMGSDGKPGLVFLINEESANRKTAANHDLAQANKA